MIFLIFSILSVCLSHISSKSSSNEIAFEDTDEDDVLDSWIPTLFGILTPLFLTFGILVQKYMIIKLKFEPFDLAFGVSLIANVLNLAFAVFYWSTYTFSLRLFVYGFFGGIIFTLARANAITAQAKGPLGPSAAVINSSSILLMAIDAVIHHRLPSPFEFASIVLGFIGISILTFSKEQLRRFVWRIRICYK
jgi:hypothetical protein